MAVKLCVVLAVAVACASATVIYSEDFGANYASNWVSSAKNADAGKFAHSAGKFFNDAEADKGLQTSQDAKFYAISAKFPAEFNSKGKDLVVQFRVKFEQNIDCGGGYVKVFKADVDQVGLHGDSPYELMFGPDICGPSNRKVHVIFSYKGVNKLTKATITPKTDEASHLYTLIVHPDNTYEVRIDGKKEHSASLFEDFDFLAAKEINDPAVSKPADWVEAKQIDDATDTKPADWVEVATIVDPEATQPADWDEESDGVWEAPTIPNPAYKGAWKVKKIDNPAYKGEWKHPQIANPDYVDDQEVYVRSVGAIGVDVWQVKSGTIFDSILVTDSVAEAEAAVSGFEALVKGEAAAKKVADDAAAAEATKKAEAEKATKAAAEDAEDDEDEDEAPAAAPKDEL